MGCDIHLYLEKFNYQTISWNPVSAKTGTTNVGANDDLEFTVFRNYVLFSILADVRNEFNIKSMSKPKGIPNNVSKRIEEKYKVTIDDHHTPSYLNLYEILFYDWESTIEQKECLNGYEYHYWKMLKDNLGCLDFGNSTKPVLKEKIISNEEMDKLLEEDKDYDKLLNTFTYVTKQVPLYEMCFTFWGKIIPIMISLTDEDILLNHKDFPLSDVRTVFWFDN